MTVVKYVKNAKTQLSNLIVFNPEFIIICDKRMCVLTHPKYVLLIGPENIQLSLFLFIFCQSWLLHIPCGYNNNIV